jgi:CheY-like chemotaxis protein
VGRGSEFIVRLPVGTTAGANGTPPPAPVADASSLAGFRIVVADDHRDSAKALAMLLKIKGNEVRTAADGFEAVELAETFRPDVILLDIGMPRLNGYDTARRIRAQPWGREIYLVALTGWGSEEDRRRSQEAGCNFHLVKPVYSPDLEKLLVAIKPTRQPVEAPPART